MHSGVDDDDYNDLELVIDNKKRKNPIFLAWYMLFFGPSYFNSMTYDLNLKKLDDNFKKGWSIGK